ncbi:MAG: DMT family transporter [Thermomicrobiales bacterium]|nr:DMT family transporter [Thermomicrobiales bacterium]
MPETQPSHQMPGVDWALLLLLGLVWGGTFFFGKVALATWPPFTVVLGRIIIGAVLLNLVARLAGHRLPRDPGLWRNLLVMGLLNSVIPFCLIVSGQTQITAGLAAILYASTSLFTVLLAPVFVAEERLTVPRLTGVLLGLGGVVVMLGPEALRDEGGATVGKLLVLGGSVSYALASIWGRRFRGVPSPVAAAGQLTVAAVIMLPLAVLVDRPWTLPPPNPQVLGAILGLGLLSTTIGYLLYFTILRRAGAVNVSLATLLVPPTSLLLGALFLGETTTGTELAGLLLIALGLLVIDGRVWQAAQRRKPH